VQLVEPDRVHLVGQLEPVRPAGDPTLDAGLFDDPHVGDTPIPDPLPKPLVVGRQSSAAAEMPRSANTSIGSPAHRFAA
jgi:hypothetical protein